MKREIVIAFAMPDMRKWLLILALLAPIPTFWNPAWGQAPSVGVDAGRNQKKQTELAAPQTKTDQRGTKDSPFVIDILSHPNSDTKAAESKTEKDHKNFVDRWTLILAALVALFTGLLVIVGWRGVKAANKTLNAIARQVDLQERAMQQWVDLVKWRHEIESVPVITMRILRIRVDVVNPTSFPLELPDAAIVFMLGEDDIFALAKASVDVNTFSFGANCRLTPHNPQTVEITAVLNDSQWNDVTTGNLRIRVEGNLDHIGILGKLQPQPVLGVLTCGIHGVTFEAHTPRNTEGKDSDRQDPN